MAMLIPTLVLISILSASGSQSARELGFAAIVGYQPTHDVRDSALIDQDLKLIADLFDQAKHIIAKDVYNRGAFSRTYATLDFEEDGITSEMDAQSPVTVASEDGETMYTGTLLNEAASGVKSVRVLYANDNPKKCYVGAHPEPVVDGCFPAEGHVRFDSYGTSLPYTYNVLEGNANDRTLAQFSKSAKDRMKSCTSCAYYPDFKKFLQYYGKADYAHRWIMSVFEAKRVVFDSSESDFTIYSLESRAQATRKAIVTMGVFMFTIRMLEESVHQCKGTMEAKGAEAQKTREKASKALDGAVAFYAGSLEDGSGSGEFLYALAESECKEFKTCGSGGDSIHGTAKVNLDILPMLNLMQANVTALQCSEARQHKDAILRKMRVPLIQGTLRYAYMRRNNEVTGTDKAIGAAYAASIVPLVASCNFKDAEIIGDAMETMTKETDFAMVKSAFEKNYACLAVTCSDVGGYWDAGKKKYHDDADPCTFDVPQSVDDDDKKKTGWAVAVPLIVIIAVLCLVKRWKSKKKKKRDRGSQDDDFSDFSSSSDDSDDNRLS